MENFAVNAIYERNESGERSAEDEKWWFNSNRTNEDFFPLKRKEQEVVTRTHISSVESQIRIEKISRSSSMCDYDEECERMDCNDEEDDDDEDDDDSLLAVEDLKSSLTTLQEQKNTKATTTKRKNDNNKKHKMIVCVRPQTDFMRLCSSKLMPGGVPVVQDSRFDRFLKKTPQK